MIKVIDSYYTEQIAAPAARLPFGPFSRVGVYPAESTSYRDSEQPMRTGWRLALSIGGILLMIGGAYFVVFGATYYGVYYSNGKGAPCLYNCSFPYTGITAVFSGYPIWSPPTWNNVNYSALLCNPSAITTYTPQNPPPSCSYPPAGWSADYSRNYAGVVMIALGAVAAVLAVRSREKAAAAEADPYPIPSDSLIQVRILPHVPIRA